MNRLWIRLSISFVLITWLAIGMVAILMSQSIESNFGHFLNTSNSLRFGPNFVEDVQMYYEENGSWDGVSDVFPGHGSGSGSGNGQGNRQGAQTFIADMNHIIVYATNQDWIGLNEDDIGTSRSIDLYQNGQVIGYLGEQTPGGIALNDAEKQFLQDTTAGLFLIAVGGSVIAFAIAIVIARSLTRPLRDFATSVEKMTASDLGQTITANGTLEISQLAASFNDLSLRLAEEEHRRRRMTADVAHELRTPLTIMRGHIEAMMDGVYPMDVQHMAVAYDQTLHLARLVEDMRLLTRAEAGQLSLSKAVIEPNELISRAIQRFQPLADDVGVNLKTKLEPDLPDIAIDVNRIQQALDNLITNALRHTTEEGSITLSTQLGANNKKVVVRVHNTGNPIPPESLGRIFDRFWRADEARERDSGGTGLGLAIAKLLVELHGGEIQVVESPNGTTFEIRLPVL